MTIRVSFRWIKLTVLIFSFFLISVGTVTAQPRSRSAEKSWSVETNIFAVIRYSAFEYQSHYNNSQVVDREDGYFQDFANNTSRTGFTGGAEIGVVSIYRHLFSWGFLLSGVAPSYKTTLTNHVDSDGAGAEDGWVDITNHSKVKYQFDLALMFGVNSTPKVFTYFKIGPSYARIDQTTNLNSYADTVNEVIFTSYKNNKKKLGGVFGLGMKYAFSKRVGIFAEYDYYYYARIKVPTIQPVYTELNPNTTLSQKVRPQFGSLRFGLNVTLW